ncbi:MAG: membrane protein insertase YidC [Nitrospirae bacterium]|nr:membrane protein insertase YidC [Nitrospirota bacterium]
MDNRTVIAVVLSFLVIVGSQYLFPGESQKAPVQKPAEQQPAPEAAKKDPTQKAEAPKAIAETVVADEKEITVENDLFAAVFTSRGGTIKSWTIKPYKDKTGKDVLLLKKPGVVPAVGIGTSSSFDLANVNFSVLGRDLKLDNKNKTGSLVFEYAKDGRSVKRTYTFSDASYLVELTDEVSGVPEYWITLGSDFGIVEKDDSIHVGPTVLTGSDLKDLKAGDLKEPKVFHDNLKWIAQQDKYFFAALVPATPVEEAKALLVQDSPVVAFKAKSGSNKFHLYAGPKENDRLEALNIGLEHVIDFGFFSIIARPLFWILKFFYQFLGNYGWAIILITIVTRIPFVPLMTKSQKSMKKLQEIQPLMNEIKEKYKKDPQKQQAEMMGLYKKHKVSPFGGCLPMLLQIPVFLALYQVLLRAIELRGAPFMLWITDLSGPDTLFGHIPAVLPLIGGFALGPLPILMGATMFIQQKMTPSSMDPTQAKMMLMMPIVFTFVFLNMASGLVLYWLIGNVLGIIQQFFVNRSLANEPAH